MPKKFANDDEKRAYAQQMVVRRKAQRAEKTAATARARLESAKRVGDTLIWDPAAATANTGNRLAKATPEQRQVLTDIVHETFDERIARRRLRVNHELRTHTGPTATASNRVVYGTASVFFVDPTFTWRHESGGERRMSFDTDNYLVLSPAVTAWNGYREDNAHAPFLYGKNKHRTYLRNSGPQELRTIFKYVEDTNRSVVSFERTRSPLVTSNVHTRGTGREGLVVHQRRTDSGHVEYHLPVHMRLMTVHTKCHVTVEYELKRENEKKARTLYRVVPVHAVYVVPVPVGYTHDYYKGIADTMTAHATEALRHFDERPAVVAKREERVRKRMAGESVDDWEDAGMIGDLYYYLWTSSDSFVTDANGGLLIEHCSSTFSVDATADVLHTKMIDLYAMCFRGSRIVHPLGEDWFRLWSEWEGKRKNYVVPDGMRLGCVQHFLYTNLYANNERARMKLSDKYCDNPVLFCTSYLGLKDATSGVGLEELIAVAERVNVSMYVMDPFGRIIVMHKKSKALQSACTALVFHIDNEHVYPIDVTRTNSYSVYKRAKRLFDGSKNKRKMLTNKEKGKYDKKGGDADALTMADARVLTTLAEWTAFRTERLDPHVEMCQYLAQNEGCGEMVRERRELVIVPNEVDLNELYRDCVFKGIDFSWGLRGDANGVVQAMRVPPYTVVRNSSAHFVNAYVHFWARYNSKLLREQGEADTATNLGATRDDEVLLKNVNPVAHSMRVFLATHGKEARRVFRHSRSCLSQRVEDMFMPGGMLSKYNMWIQDQWTTNGVLRGPVHDETGQPCRVDLKLAYASSLRNIHSGFPVYTLESAVEPFDVGRCTYATPDGEYAVRFVAGYYFLAPNLERLQPYRWYRNGHVTAELLGWLVHSGLVCLADGDVQHMLLGDPNRRTVGCQHVTLLRMYTEWVLDVYPWDLAKGLINRYIGSTAMKRHSTRMEKLCTRDVWEAAYYRARMLSQPNGTDVSCELWKAEPGCTDGDVMCITGLRGHSPLFSHMPVLHTVVDTMVTSVMKLVVRLKRVVSVRMDAVEYTKLGDSQCERELDDACKRLEEMKETSGGNYRARDLLGHVQFEKPKYGFRAKSESAATVKEDDSVSYEYSRDFARNQEPLIEIMQDDYDDRLDELAERLLATQNRSVMLTAHAGMGKTHFVKHHLVPAMTAHGLSFRIVVFMHGSKNPYRGREREYNVCTIDSTFTYSCMRDEEDGVARNELRCAENCQDTDAVAALYDVLVVDECSTIPIDRLTRIACYRRMYPHTQLFVVGDRWQTAPYEPHMPYFVRGKRDYFDTAIPALCCVGRSKRDDPTVKGSCLMYNFKKQWRMASDPPFAALAAREDYVDGLTHNDFCQDHDVVGHYVDVNLTASNYTRKYVNEACEQELASRNGVDASKCHGMVMNVFGTHGVKGNGILDCHRLVGGLAYVTTHKLVGDGKEWQEWMPLVGQPVVCRVNRAFKGYQLCKGDPPTFDSDMEYAQEDVQSADDAHVLYLHDYTGEGENEPCMSDVDIQNHHRVRIVGLSDFWVQLDVSGCTHVDRISVPWGTLFTRFLPGYACTVQSWQGSSIDEPARIWDWLVSDRQVRYTALTRFTHSKYVTIMPPCTRHRRCATEEKLLAMKLHAAEEYDERMGRSFTLTTGQATKLLTECKAAGGLCPVCGVNMFDYTRPYLLCDPHSWTLDDTRYTGHTAESCRIVCLGCNRQRKLSADESLVVRPEDFELEGVELDEEALRGVDNDWIVERTWLARAACRELCAVEAAGREYVCNEEASKFKDLDFNFKYDRMW